MDRQGTVRSGSRSCCRIPRRTLYSLCIVFAVVVISILCIILKGSNTESPTTKTKSGVLAGKYMTSRNGNTYEAFLGIRYGVIPERFEISVPSPAWNGTRDVIEFGPACPQQNGLLGIETIISEDCLFLNVYTPKADDKKREVLVFIHGGGFTAGSGNGYGAKYFIDEDIVLVTLNYRLGILGFLNVRDGHVYGNMGLKDQVLALKWIQANIEAFGGDPFKVTISGESAGGASVVHLLLSPMAKGLFRSAVAQSGSALDTWAYQENTISNAAITGKHLNCNTDSYDELVADLKDKPAPELISIKSLFVKWHRDPSIGFPPSLEIKDEYNTEPFLEDSPVNLANAGKFNRVPVLLTVNKDEGALLRAAPVIRNPDLLKQMNDNWEQVAPVAFMFGYDPQLQGRIQEVAQKIRNFYFNDERITLEHESNLTNLYTDSWFLYGIHKTALAMAKHTPVFTAQITHIRKDFSILSHLGVEGIITHAEELPYLYSSGSPEDSVVSHEIVESDDLEFSKGFVKVISSFAKIGTPEVTFGNSPNWSSVTKPEIETGQLNWLNLNLHPVIEINPFKERMAFWDSLYK